MMTPGFGVGGFSENHVEGVASGIERSQTQIEGGLYVPKSIAEQRQQQVSLDNSQNEQVLAPDAGEETTGEVVEPAEVSEEGSDAASKTTAERVEDNEANLIEIADSPTMKAQSEEEFIEESAKDAAARGEDPDETKKDARKWLDRAAAVAGMTFNEFKTAQEGSSMDLFIKSFLVFDTEGRFGDTSRGSLKDALGKDNDDAYLNEALEKGGSKALLEFFRETLDKPNLTDLNEIKDLVKAFNAKAEVDWADLVKSMGTFLNDPKRGYGYKERSFSKIKALFSRLEGMSAENILKYFNIESDQETADTSSGESAANDGGASVQSGESAPANNPAEMAA